METKLQVPKVLTAEVLFLAQLPPLAAGAVVVGSPALDCRALELSKDREAALDQSLVLQRVQV